MTSFRSSMFILIFLIQPIYSHAISSLTVSAPLLQNQTPVSSNQMFELSFFKPNGSENQYVGICYKNVTRSKVVWVANGQNPLQFTDMLAIFDVGRDGNLKLADGQMNTAWSTNVSVQSKYTVATLLDNGNFVLADQCSNCLWARSDHPTDTLSNVKPRVNLKTGEKLLLISWRCDNDPSPGNFVLGMTSEMQPQAFTWNGSNPYWRSGQRDKSKFIGVPSMGNRYLSGYPVEQDPRERTAYFYIDNYSSLFYRHMFISPGGSLKLMHWDDGANNWLTSWEAPANHCQFHGTYGPFGICSPKHSAICRCLQRFKPKFVDEGSRGNRTGGCIRETELNCTSSTRTSVSTSEKQDVFVQMSQMKLPDSAEYLQDIGDAEGCQSWCLDNCSCLGYSYVRNTSHMAWSAALVDVMEFPSKGISAQTKLTISLTSVFGIICTGTAIFGVHRLRASRTGMIGLLSSLFMLIFLIQPHDGRTINSITASSPLLQNQTLVSPGQIFELGFFTPNGSQNQYVGIRYKNMTPSKVVWVANREKPLPYTDMSVTLKIGSNGNLQLVDGQMDTVWSTNVSVLSNYTAAKLLDSGNFVLADQSSDNLWTSFDNPTDTLLPKLRLGLNSGTGGKNYLISWRSDNDPSPGNFFVGMTTETPPQPFTWNGSKPYWRGGSWDKSTFIGIPAMENTYLNGNSVNQSRGTATFSYEIYNNSFVFISPGGLLKQIYWDDQAKSWSKSWEAPANRCEVYGTCGPFGICNPMHSPICRCLKGFKPKFLNEWSSGNWTGGCIRETELNCQNNVSISVSTFAKPNVFVQMSQMKLPDRAEYLRDIRGSQECQSWCLNNCSCLGYSYVSSIGCMAWSEALIDIMEFSSTGKDLFFRLAHTDTGISTQTKLIISLSSAFGSIFIGAVIFGVCRLRANCTGSCTRNPALLNTVDGNTWKGQLGQDNAPELTHFSLDSILIATNNFDEAKKLGQGGFGLVYKGKLIDGKEVAMKRLSSTSVQGIQEFKNEIVLISKLQHRNLVKLVGCCMDAEEKILVYEYMANKSLDSFLFDSEKKDKLDWNRRFHVILGVARGLLYLHRDSCLRIIHRDLKASNILLDEHMNPKISDFGLARMFDSTEVLVNTHKVVGTFGYMAPEYAMGGLFSEKSDIYSFGVLLLEIVSGLKNKCLYYRGQHISLLSYAWQLWSEGKALDLLDNTIADNYSQSEVMRCVQVGVLCVQDHATDRPNMLAVVLMLNGETDLPKPRQPTFTFQREMSNHAIESCQDRACSLNTVTNTVVEGR